MSFDALLAAIESADPAAVTEVLARAKPTLLEQTDAADQTLLDHALWALLVDDWSRPPTLAPDVEGRRLAIVRELLDAGADPRRRGRHGWTPLHTALYENHVPLTRELLARGADPRAETDASGGTPLVHGLFWGHAEAADALATQDVSPPNLRIAAGLGRADLLDALLDTDGRLDPGAGRGRAWYRPHDDFPAWVPSDDRQELLDEALSYAARSGRDEVLPLLLDRGANVRGDSYAGAALHWVAAQGRVPTCLRLLDAGADVDQRSTFGSQLEATPLHCAASMDRLDTARLLLERGADPTLRDGTHAGTPLDWAEHRNAPAVAALLRGA